MLLIDSLAEEQIQSAIRRGDFEDLPGQGRPLELEDESAVPEELRVAYRLLKNAGCLPPVLGLRNEINEVEGLLNRVEIDSEQETLRCRLSLLQTRLAIYGREINLLTQQSAYREKVLRRISKHDRSDAAGTGGGQA